MAAHITSCLSQGMVNIAFMRLFREAKGDTAYSIVEFDGELPEEVEGWAASCFAKDPSGNELFLWKCPPSRTWEEPEAGYDEE